MLHECTSLITHTLLVAISLAEMKGFVGLGELQARHLQWLLDTRQEEKAAELKEKSREYSVALSLYLKANMPARAARCVPLKTTIKLVLIVTYNVHLKVMRFDNIISFSTT